jgi:hypothetical protein
MPRYAAIPRHLKNELDRIPPSRDRGLEYFPCAVTLDDGRELERVYVAEYEPYIRLWGVTPEQDPAKSSVAIERVASIRESPYRLPPGLATELYAAGESGMGYSIFTVEFADGSREAYVTGNAVDFITAPEGLRASDARKVFPHKGRDASPRRGADYSWCLYQGVRDAR